MTFEPELREYVSFTTSYYGCNTKLRLETERFLYYGCTTKLRLSSRSSGSTFPLLHLTAVLQSCDLTRSVFFTTAVLQNCDFRAGAPGVRFLYYGCTTKVRLSSKSSGSTFPLLRLYYKVATLMVCIFLGFFLGAPLSIRGGGGRLALGRRD